jgi:hypothetical protein
MKVHREKHSTYQCVVNTYYKCNVCSFDCGALGSVSGNGLDTFSCFTVLFGFQTTSEMMRTEIILRCPFGT